MTRLATPEDCDAVVALWQACGLTRPWNDARADFERAVGGVSSDILLLEKAGRLAATVMVGDDGHRGWVYYLAVKPDCRKQGLGRTMMAAAEHWLRERDAPKIQLMVRDDNEAAIGFYKALGYDVQPVVTIGRRLD
ncbi:GNAT family acetyltransferase [Sphingopyxis sp. BSNA05]|uniref:GNAT family acetyltransferase n=1 Tax=Sphingopyxis sp. BSNA05 TaxID=1236614 RepID=UPI0015667A4E|nr:GNAT family acetyltransferase [Sphingopyxis sp. BSNA05]NRD88997.1 GNAT family acetyltransferase [Sphingopyxis sp. BSNA05]